MNNRRQGAVDVIEVTESLTHETVTEFQNSVQEVLPHGQPRIVLNLASMTLCDSKGLEYLLDLRDSCLRRGGLMKLCAATPLCKDILYATGLLDQIELYSTEVDALGSFAI